MPKVNHKIVPDSVNLDVVQVWAPLRCGHFRRLWIANLIANLGNGMHAFAVAWLIATTSHAASVAAMAQTLAYAPLILFALPAGVIADVLDRPKVLFLANLLMAVCSSGCFIVLVVLSPDSPLVSVLVLTFVYGAGNALRWPAWQAFTCDLVSPRQLEAVTLLENTSLNVGAIGGPLLGSLLLTWGSAKTPFVASALGFSGMLALLWTWRNEGHRRRLNGCLSWPAMKNGLSTVLVSSLYRGILRRAASVYFVLISFAALLPVYVRDVVQRSADVYAIFSASLGAGAALAAFLLPALRKQAGQRNVFIAGLSGFGLVMVLLTQTRSLVLIGLLTFIAGIAWCSVISTMFASAQTAFPSELRARALSLYLLVMATALTLGSMFWGTFADYMGVASAVAAAGLASIVNAVLIFCFRSSTVGKSI